MNVEINFTKIAVKSINFTKIGVKSINFTKIAVKFGTQIVIGSYIIIVCIENQKSTDKSNINHRERGTSS